MTNSNHPVWSVYDKLRTARLNVKYYTHELQTLKRWNLLIDVVLAATTSTSAIAGLWFWKSVLGNIIWQYIGVLSAVMAVIKPILKLSDRIKDTQNIVSGYSGLEYDLREIKALIEQKQKYDSKEQDAFIKAIKREKELVEKTPVPGEKRKVKATCEREVRLEFPKESFFVPNP